MDRRPEMRRTMTLWEQLSKPDAAIRDFLKIPHDDGGPGDAGTASVDAAGGDGGMFNWKTLRDRHRLLRAAAAWTTTTSPKPAAANGALSDSKSGSNRSNKYNYSPGEAAAAFSRTFSRSPSLRATPTFSRGTSTRVGTASELTSSRSTADADDEEEEDDDDDEEEEGEAEAPAAQMSLMALLEQTDNQWDDEEENTGAGAAPSGGAPKKSAAGEEDDDDGEARVEEMVHVCCVCMLRHKGAAFIPCGHTFCRLCSRELWVSRGNCPLCNGFIQEILDIF